MSISKDTNYRYMKIFRTCRNRKGSVKYSLYWGKNKLNIVHNKNCTFMKDKSLLINKLSVSDVFTFFIKLKYVRSSIPSTYNQDQSVCHRKPYLLEILAASTLHLNRTKFRKFCTTFLTSCVKINLLSECCFVCRANIEDFLSKFLVQQIELWNLEQLIKH